LPDAFTELDLEENPEIKETLGGLTTRSFDISPDDCSPEHKIANARCFAAMLKLRSDSFDSCAKNVINQNGNDTVGNIMCTTITDLYSEDNIPVKALNKGIRVSTSCFPIIKIFKKI